jgi:hypothetical protein
MFSLPMHISSFEYQKRFQRHYAANLEAAAHAQWVAYAFPLTHPAILTQSRRILLQHSVQCVHHCRTLRFSGTNLWVQILCFWVFSIVLSLSKNTKFRRLDSVSGLQVERTQLGPIDRASPYLRTRVPAPRWGIKANHSTNHLWDLRKH